MFFVVDEHTYLSRPVQYPHGAALRMRLPVLRLPAISVDSLNTEMVGIGTI